jgi:hypothetical protein
MKKLFCLVLALAGCLIFSGCQNDESLPEESSEKWEVVSLENDEYMSGEIIEIQAPDILVLKLRSPKYGWGDTIYVVTKDAEKWCVGDKVELGYSSIQQASGDSKSQRIIADWVDTPFYNEKPILYFYPETPTLCSAKILLDGELTCTYPAHGADGWKDFVANPDGTLNVENILTPNAA